jgi:hypothetical protein
MPIKNQTQWMQKKSQKAIDLLHEIIKLWDEWTNSYNPTILEDTPVD